MRLPRRSLHAIAGVALATSLGCASPPEPGEWGRFRHFGVVAGEAPLDLIPPTADREGNLYVLFGGLETLNVEGFVGGRGGRWARGCGGFLAGSDFGVHGWVGHAEQKVWFWHGYGLFFATHLGTCFASLDKDPSTGADLRFVAIVPWVRITPSRTTAVAWIQSPSDPRPFQVLLHLDREDYSTLTEFEPKSATEVLVLGVGANVNSEEGVILVRYLRGETVHVEARFVDGDAAEVARVAIPGLDDVLEFGVAGYLQANDQGLYAGLLSTGDLLVLDKSGGRRKNVGGMSPIGVHRYGGNLYLVGTDDGRAVIAPIDDTGGVGKVQPWDASKTAAAALNGNVEIVDDRRLPSRTLTWKSPTSAIGPQPFLSPFSPEPYADGTTLWAIAGPQFDFGGEPRTAAAVAPVGISYP